MKKIDCEVGAVQREINAFLEKEREKTFEEKNSKNNIFLKIYEFLKRNNIFTFLKNKN